MKLHGSGKRVWTCVSASAANVNGADDLLWTLLVGGRQRCIVLSTCEWRASRNGDKEMAFIAAEFKRQKRTGQMYP